MSCLLTQNNTDLKAALISGTRLSLFLNVQSAISHIVTCCVANVCCSMRRQEKRRPRNDAKYVAQYHETSHSLLISVSLPVLLTTRREFLFELLFISLLTFCSSQLNKVNIAIEIYLLCPNAQCTLCTYSRLFLCLKF